jgi:hypothetical protein
MWRVCMQSLSFDEPTGDIARSGNPGHATHEVVLFE